MFWILQSKKKFFCWLFHFNLVLFDFMVTYFILINADVELFFSLYVIFLFSKNIFLNVSICYSFFLSLEKKKCSKTFHFSVWFVCGYRAFYGSYLFNPGYHCFVLHFYNMIISFFCYWFRLFCLRI